MYHILYQIIGNLGDGSNHTEYSTDERVVEIKRQKADEGNETYASGDGLQVIKFRFKTKEDIDRFIMYNVYDLHTLDNRDEWDY
jgi:hypothetical protein